VDAFLEDSTGKRIPLKDGFVIGRIPGCDLVITDTKASRRHARIVVQGSLAEVEDLESANGTLLNGKPVQRRVLRPGDQITIGTTVLRYGEGLATADAVSVPAKQRIPAAAEPEELDLGQDPPQATPAPLSSPAPVLRKPPPADPAPPAAQPAAEILEFVDEVVSVRPRQATPVQPATGGAGKNQAPSANVQRSGGVLQFQAQRNAQKRAGLLGDDLAQMSLGKRALLALLGLAFAGGVGWLVMTLVRG